MEHSSSLKSNKTIIHTTQKNVPSIYNLKTKEKALKNEFKCKEKVNQDWLNRYFCTLGAWCWILQKEIIFIVVNHKDFTPFEET